MQTRTPAGGVPRPVDRLHWSGTLGSGHGSKGDVMATLVEPGKLKRVYWVDADGKKVKKGTPGATRREWTNTKYYIRYRDGKKFKQRPAHRDKRASEKKMQDLVRAVERGQEGLVDRY